MTPEEKYNEITVNIPDITPGKMFGALCLKTPNRKAACMFYKDAMIFKLPKEVEQEALSLDGAKPFEPMPGRKMGGWTEVPFNYADRWEEFTKTSVDYVKKL